MMPSLSDLWDDGDDWTGVTSTAERRKRQNRLSQRAYRKRRHLQRLSALVSNRTPDSLSGAAVVRVNANHPCSTHHSIDHPGDTAQGVEVVGTTIHVSPSANPSDARRFILVLCPQTRNKAVEFAQRFFPDFNFSQTQAPSDLPMVLHLNFLNALAHNALVLGISFEELSRDEGISPFNFQGPSRALATTATVTAIVSATGTVSAPNNLHPTELQRTVVHHPWVDLLPLPGMRDNILRGIEAGSFDDDELCCDLGAYEDVDSDFRTTFVVWGEPWDIKNWEISAGFLEKWGWLLQGCPELVESTNFWREKRGERRIEFITN